MSIRSNANFVSLDGRSERYLNEKERKTAYGGVFALVRMEWEDIEEKSFENEYKFWIASKEDAKDVSFEVKKEITKEEIKEFFDKNKSKFEEPKKLKQMKMFERSDYVCVAKNAINFNPKEMQTAGGSFSSMSKRNLVYFKNESNIFKVCLKLFPYEEKQSHSTSTQKAAIEGGHKGLLSAIISAECTNEVKTIYHKGSTYVILKPGETAGHNCPDGRGNYNAYVYDDQKNQLVFFQSGYVENNEAKNPVLLKECGIEMHLTSLGRTKDQMDVFCNSR